MHTLTEAALRDGVPADCPGAVWAFIAIAAGHSMSGDFAAAIRTIEEAEVALTAAGDAAAGLSFLYSAAANFHNLMGDRDAARSTPSVPLEAARRSKNPTAIASAQFAARSRSRTTIRRGGTAPSTRASRSVGAVRAVACSGSRWPVGRCCGPMPATSPARVATRREAVRHGHERGDRPMLSSALECSVAVLHAMGRDEAAALLAGALLAGVATGCPAR